MDFRDQVRILDPANDREVFDPLVRDYQRLVGRKGLTPDVAAHRLETRNAVAAAMLLNAGQVDAAICGGIGDWSRQVQYVLPVLQLRAGVERVFAMSALILQAGVLFMADTHMVVDPSCEQIAEMTILAAEAVRDFGLVPKVALLSHSSFGASGSASAQKMRAALATIREREPDLEIDGEMHADAALSEAIRKRSVPDSQLAGTANLLIMPNLDAANIAFNLLKAAAEGLPVGPILLGTCKPLHVLVPSVTARGIVNLTAIASREAQVLENK
jgi:malate dehydrogenase (oxaloacetate-decarboxylating)(NADP+)